MPPKRPTPTPTCPACEHFDSTELERVHLAGQHQSYSTDPAVYARLTLLAGIPGDSYQMRKCLQCGLEFADPLKAPGDEWYRLTYEILALYPSTRWEFDFVAQKLSRDSRVGELGCGSGAFLQRCKDAGAPAIGVDFSSDAIASCHAAGLDAHVVDVASGSSKAQDTRDRNVVAAFQVLEHLDAPGSLFEMANTWATPGATLWVAIPSDRRPSRYFAERDYLDQPPHHMTRWTGPALAAIGEHHGWKIEQLHYEPISAKTLTWWFSIHTALYRCLPPPLRRMRLFEIAVRLALYPLAACRAMASAHRISGQTMLAEYRRKHG